MSAFTSGEVTHSRGGRPVTALDPLPPTISDDTVSLARPEVFGRLAERRVSVVQATINQVDDLRVVLSQPPHSVWQAVLVDAGSAGDTIYVTGSLRPDARVLTRSRRGKGNALAIGFAQCRGAII